MIKAINSKTFENLKGGVKEGVGTAWKASKRVQFRSPLVYDKPAPAASWAGLGFLSVAALALGAWLYFRKRKEVADRYTMGERTVGEGPGADWEAGQVPVSEQMPNLG